MTTTITLTDPQPTIRDAMAEAKPLAEVGAHPKESDQDRLNREMQASSIWFLRWLGSGKNSRASWSEDRLYDYLVRKYRQRKIRGKAKRHRVRHRIIALMPLLQRDWDDWGILRFAPHLYAPHFGPTKGTT